MAEKKFRIAIDPQVLVPVVIVRKYYLAAVVGAMLMTGVVALTYSRLPRVVPLFFTEPWGEARLAPKGYLYMLPGLSLLIAMVNVVVSRVVSAEYRAVIHALAIGSLAVVTMMGIALYGIIQSLL